VRDLSGLEDSDSATDFSQWLQAGSTGFFFDGGMTTQNSGMKPSIPELYAILD